MANKATRPGSPYSSLDGYQLDDEVQIVSRQLSCVFEKSQQELKTAIAELKPVLVLAVGQAGGRTELCFEKVAINFIDARIADNAGQQPVGTPVVTDGPTGLFYHLANQSYGQQPEATRHTSSSVLHSWYLCL